MTPTWRASPGYETYWKQRNGEGMYLLRQTAEGFPFSEDGPSACLDQIRLGPEEREGLSLLLLRLLALDAQRNGKTYQAFFTV
jgi:hypothetical protein